MTAPPMGSPPARVRPTKVPIREEATEAELIPAEGQAPMAAGTRAMQALVHRAPRPRMRARVDIAPAAGTVAAVVAIQEVGIAKFKQP
jgi:hypothetical protein